MKIAAILLVSLFLISLGLLGYVYFTADITVDTITTVAMEAAAQQPTFDSIQSQMEKGQLIGTVYDTQIPGDSSAYQFIVYTIRLKNTSPIPAERVEVQVNPAKGDVMQMGDPMKRTLAPMSQGDITATILTSQDTPPHRTLKITCYLWGIPCTIQTHTDLASTK